jgi:hypothetical protein
MYTEMTWRVARGGTRRAAALAAMLAGLAGGTASAAAQTDYYNTDARRPVRVEDAYPVERYAWEAQVAPLRLERLDGGAYQWEVEPELAYGLLPRTHLEVGVPLIIFDNLHMMHDVVSDVLVSPEVPRGRKRAEILKAAAMFRDDTSFVIPVEEWRAMGEMMGVHNMGGPAAGFIAALPEPTVPRGMSMAGMDHSGHGAAPAEDEHAGHVMPAEHREEMMRLMHPTGEAHHAGHGAKPAPKPAPKPADPHAGHRRPAPRPDTTRTSPPGEG